MTFNTLSSSSLPFQLDFEIKDLKTITFKRTIQTKIVDAESKQEEVITETKKKEVPIITAGASKHQVLHCIYEFENTRQSLRWTGSQSFENIQDILQAHDDLQYWKTQILQLRAQKKSLSEQNYLIMRDMFINYKFGHNMTAYAQHKRFLQSIRKTRSLSVSQFASLVHYHNEVLLPLLPGHPPKQASIPKSDIKFILFEAMPEAWKYDYDRFHDVHSESLQNMTAFMEKCYNYSKSKESNNNNTKKKNENNRNSGSQNRRNNGNSRNNRGKFSRGNNNGNSNKQDSNLNGNSQCPVHPNGNHTWKQCRFNPSNSNNSNRNNNWNNRNSNRSNNNSGDNQVNEQAETRSNGGFNSSGNSSGKSSENGDGMYCQFISSTTKTETADLWIDQYYVDCEIDSEYYYQDLQRFPPVDFNEQFTNVPYEEAFATEEKQQQNKNILLSPAPPPTEAAKPITRSPDPVDLSPSTIATCNQINDFKGKFHLKTLFDSGSTFNIITRRSLPTKVKPFKLKNSIRMNTAKGSYDCTDFIYLHNVTFPEISYSRKCRSLKALVVDSNMPYHLIIGRQYMKEIALKMDFETSTVHWYDKSIQFHPRNYFEDSALIRKLLSNEPYAIAEAYINQANQQAYVDSSTKYEETDLDKLVSEQSHLAPEEQQKLLSILKKFPVLFEGLNNKELGIFPNREYHIGLESNAKPFHIKQPYAIPLHQQDAVKKELLRQIALGIISRCYATEWGMPAFVVPKPDGSCRLVADFRELNKVTKKLVYPLPKIQDIFHRRRGFRYVTLLDVSMQFHTFKLDEESTWKCVIVTPFGKFRLLRLPMGFLNSPSWAQGAMEELFNHLDNVDIYIDDIGIFSNSFEEHCKTVEAVLAILQNHKFSIKPAKCHWFQSSAPWLGHIISTDGIRPNPVKIEPILKLSFPSTVTELRSFIGMVNFYRNFWRKRAELMAPLTALSGQAKGKLKPTPELIRSFNAIKALIAEEVLLAFPDPNVPYDVYTDASDYQLGAVLMQNGKTVAFFSRKLNTAQRKYPTIDKEMLCIVEVFKEFRTILWGAKIRVHTDHLNLTRQNISSNRIMTWRMLLEEFSPVFHYIKGPNNIIADALSRLPREEEEDSAPPEPKVPLEANYKPQDLKPLEATENRSVLELSDLFINYPADLPQFPIAFDRLALAQAADPDLQNKAHYQDQQFYEHTLKVYTKNGNTKIVIPQQILADTVKWYHFTLGHCGIERLIKAISQHLYAPGLRAAVEAFCKTCEPCQKYKNPGVGVGYLATRQENKVPFEEIAIDTIGPWTFKFPGLGKITFNAYSIIDNCTNLLELKRASQANPTGIESVHVLDDSWLSRYPKPVRVIFDQGKEYQNIDFESHLVNLGIKPVPTSVKNPQANAILERVHDVMKAAMRTELSANQPENIQQANQFMDRVLASAQYAVRCSVNKTYGLSPGSIVFHRDMIMPIPIISDLNYLRQKRQAVINKNNLNENRRRKYHEYNVGDRIAVLTYKPNALEARATGPFTITQVHSTNGTVSFLRNEQVIERINIRRIKPYY